MSAETTRKQSKQAFLGHTVLPQPISDPSLIKSVAGYIHEVVPQAYSSVLPGEAREQQIVWARFESADYNDPENYPQIAECESDTTPPLLLVLGYGTGAQVWSIAGSGEATEVLTWSLGTVRVLRLLHCPQDKADPFASKRPLVAIVDSAGPGPQYCTVNFVSLKSGDVIKTIKFKSPICDILCNKKSVVITFVEKIAVFDVTTLEDRLTVTTCYPSPGICANPVALGQRWLAYSEKRLTTWNRSSGGCEGDGAQSYTATAIHAVKSLGKGLRDLGGSLTGNIPPPSNNNSSQPGIVTVVDIETKVSKEDDSDNIVAHFVAHVGPVVAMAFDASGMLLVTADKHGHRFHVFRIQPHPVASQLAAVHHLYILHRGETTARVQDITVSRDSRWVAISSVRGTTHVFPITPYGGPVTVRTHTTPNVVNRLSRFERSAGLSDGRGSPLLEAPSQPLTPRLPPYPHPTTLSALAQLRKVPLSEESPLAAIFGAPRAWLPGRSRGRRGIVESLFVISSTGTLIQYDLEPKCLPGVPKDKVSYDTGIELGVDAKAEWCLMKPLYSSNMQPPLPVNNPLLICGKLPSFDSTPPPEDRWLSQVEIITHTGPHRRLWMGPQFTFKPVDPLPTGSEEEYEPGMTNSVRSNPVNMPHTAHKPYLLIEGSAGSSLETPSLTGYSSSAEDMVHGESRLREDLADAMLETAPHNSGGVVGGGGKMRAALLERQVNPLGTVITLPTDGSTPPPLQFILPAQVLHPSLDRPSSSRHSQPTLPNQPTTSRGEGLPVDYLNLALPCVPCVVNQLMESGSPPYVPAPLNEPELPDPFLEVMEDTGRPSSSLILSKVMAGETKTKGKTRKKKHSLGDKPKGKPPPPPSTFAPLEDDSADVGSKIPFVRSPDVPKAAPRKIKQNPLLFYQNPLDPIQLTSVSSSSDIRDSDNADAEVATLSCDLEEPASFVSESFDLLRNASVDGNLTLLPLEPLTASLHELNISVEPNPLPVLEVDTILFEPSITLADEVEPAEPSSLIDFSCDRGDHSCGDIDAPEETPNDSESNSEPITAVNISRDTSFTDIKSEANENEVRLETEQVSDILVEDETVYKIDDSLQPDSLPEKVVQDESIEAVKKPGGQPVKKLRNAGKNKSKRKEYKIECETTKEEVSSTSCDSEKSELPPAPQLSLLEEPTPETVNIFPKPLEAPFAYSAAVAKIVTTSSEIPDTLELVERRRQNKLKNKPGSLDCSLVEKPDADSSSETVDTAESRTKGASTSTTSNHETSSQSEADLIDSKRGRRERTKKLKSAESLEEIKKKSPSPSKAEVKPDTDSSDEAVDQSVEKTASNPPKQIKRKKGKKNDEIESPTPDVKLRTKSKSEGTLDAAEKSDYDTCSEKKSDSSIESFTETKKRQSDPNGNFSEAKSWSSVVKNEKEPAAKPHGSGEDRDSVYESCNDEVPEVDSVAFESSKEDFEEPKIEQVGESSSSNTEEKTEDSGDKETSVSTVAEPGKKVKKQKRKRR